MHRTAITSLLVLAPALAAADTGTDSVHQFATLDRASGTTEAGADLSVITGDFGGGHGWISRLDLHGQYMMSSNWGFYGALAASKAFLSTDNMDPIAAEANDKFALSSLELGGQYRTTLDDDWSLVAHAGLVLPTASSGSLGAIITNVLSVAGRRYNDGVTGLPKTTTLRLGVSPSWSKDGLFARVDLGADVPLYQSDAPDGFSRRPILHGNVAAGARSGKLSAALEIVTLASTESLMDGADRFFHTASASLQYDAGSFATSLALVTPLGGGSTGDVIGIGLGVTSKF